MLLSRTPKIAALALLALAGVASAFAQTTTLVRYGSDGKLVYTPNSRGDVVPDYSGVGYKNGDVAIPTVPVVHTIGPGNAADIQAAINYVASLPIQPNGFRGAIRFTAGTYTINETIYVRSSGIVLLGEGTGTNGTRFNYTRTSQSDCLKFVGSGGVSLDAGSRSRIQGNLSNGAGGTYVPFGQKFVRLSSGHGFAKGNRVVIHHQPNQAWLNLLKMNNGWTVGGSDFQAERVVVDVKGNDVYLDAPIMESVDSRYGVADLVKISGTSRINNCGVENIRFTSSYRSDTDEAHGWKAVVFDNVEHGWARGVDAYYFGYSCVSIDSDNAIWITVENCRNYDPKSKSDGGRKYSFNNNGQRALFINCEAIGTAPGRGGRHDFVSGSWTPGPSVFYNCRAVNSITDSGPHHRWTTGHLYDNVDVNSEIRVRNRGYTSSGSLHGWVGAQIMIWNSVSDVVVQNPPGPNENWAIGCIGSVNAGSDGEPAGIIQSTGTHITEIPSLYLAQLQERLNNTTPLPKAAAPVPSQPSGTYVGSVTVALTSSTADARIYYTTDGSAPTASSSLYSSALNITTTTTLKAITYADGFSASDVLTATYTINAPSGGGVIFYQNNGYGGAAGQPLAKGSYTLSQLAAKGVPNDWASSVKIPAGWRVTIYSANNFAGTSWVLTTDTPIFSALSPTANDVMSSCRIE
jgi:hypothetical protein